MEFSGREALQNAVLDLGGSLNLLLMVPLSLQVSYKGFTCLIEPSYPFENANIVHGKNNNEFVQKNYIKDSLSKIGKYLNLRPHTAKGRVSGDSHASEVLISQNLQIYNIPKLSIEDLLIEKDQGISGEIKRLKIQAGSVSLSKVA